MVGSSNLAGSGPNVWNCGIAGAGAGWWDTSEPLGEGASAAPAPVADGGACDMGEDIADELSGMNVSRLFLAGSVKLARAACAAAVVEVEGAGKKWWLWLRRLQQKRIQVVKVKRQNTIPSL